MHEDLPHRIQMSDPPTEPTRILSRDRYHSILSRLREVPVLSVPHFRNLSKQYSIHESTVSSIYYNDWSTKVIKAAADFKRNAPALLKRYLDGEDVLEMCMDLQGGYPPCFVMRRLLEVIPFNYPSPSTKYITSIFKDVSLLSNLLLRSNSHDVAVAPGVGPIHQKLDMDRLRRDIERCVLCDTVCGPSSDTARQNAGLEKESVLREHLNAAGIEYWTEDDLREDGHFKTPDIRLVVPIAVQGNVVQWIDSKATFGDEQQHKENLERQFHMYVNRYGTGLVIYWHGYVADASDIDGGLNHATRSVMVMDRFPAREQLTLLPRLPIIPTIVVDTPSQRSSQREKTRAALQSK